MNCKKVIKYLPLLLGNEISERKGEKLKKHIEKCENCKKEFLEYQMVLKSLRKIEEGIDWEEKEWKILMNRVLSQNIREEISILTFLKKPAIQVLAFILLISFALIFVRRDFINNQEIHMEKNNLPIAKLERKDVELPEVRKVEIMEKGKGFSEPKVETVQKEMMAEKEEMVLKEEIKKEESEQTLISMTIVLKETGLKIVWFFNKNFEWKEEK